MTNANLITGAEAGEMLEELSEAIADQEKVGDIIAAEEVLRDNAEPLARTVAWLYGRPEDKGGGWDTEGFHVSVNSFGEIFLADGIQDTALFPPEAVELARCILAAAQKAQSEEDS